MVSVNLASQWEPCVDRLAIVEIETHETIVKMWN